MSDMELLQLKALESCAFRGHAMGPWERGDWPLYNVAVAWCEVCGAIVSVNNNPAPNSAHILGHAVALTCEPKE